MVFDYVEGCDTHSVRTKVVNRCLMDVEAIIYDSIKNEIEAKYGGLRRVDDLKRWIRERFPFYIREFGSNVEPFIINVLKGIKEFCPFLEDFCNEILEDLGLGLDIVKVKVLDAVNGEELDDVLLIVRDKVYRFDRQCEIRVRVPLMVEIGKDCYEGLRIEVTEPGEFVVKLQPREVDTIVNVRDQLGSLSDVLVKVSPVSFSGQTECYWLNQDGLLTLKLLNNQQYAFEVLVGDEPILRDIVRVRKDSGTYAIVNLQVRDVFYRLQVIFERGCKTRQLKLFEQEEIQKSEHLQSALRFKVRIYDEMDRLLGEGFNGDIIPLSRPVKPGERVNVRAYPIDESGKYIPHLYDPLKRFMEDEKSGTMAISFDQRLRPLIDVAREKNGLKLKFRDTAFYRKLKERISETEFKEKPPEFSEKSFGEYLEWSDCDGVKAIFGGENEGRKLYKHQDKALIELGSSGERKCIIVSSGMASGKTEIAVLYLLKAYKQHPDFGYAVVVYPTRELLRDQYARWRRYFESAYDLGYMYPVVEVAKYYGEVARGSKGQEELAKIKGGRCVILTTASTFCSQEFLSLLKRPPKVVVLDEVHFYRSFDLTLLMEFLRFATLRRGGFEKLMIFSATMGNADDFKRMVSHVLNVDGCLIHGEPIRGRKTIYIVDLSGLEEREQESLVDKVLEECSKRLDEKTIVFASNRTEAEGYYYHKLHKWGAKAALHIGDMSMAERKMAARKFRVGKCKWMVTVRTLEVGIDIGDVSRIVHLGLPPSMNEFMQREGRSGRQGQESESIIFARTKGELERAQTWVEEMRQGSSELLCRVTFNPQSLLAKKIREETSERWPNKINIKGVSVKCKVFGGLRFQLQLPPEFRGRDEVYTRDVIFRYLPYSIRRRRWKKLYVEKVEMKMMNSARRVILRHVEDNPEVRKLVESKAFYTTTSRVKTIIEPLSQPSGDMTTVKVRFRPLCVNYVGRSTRKISRIGGVTEVPQYFVMQRFDVADEVAWRLERLSEDFTRGFIISIEIPKDILRELIMGIAEGEEDTEKILSEIQWQIESLIHLSLHALINVVIQSEGIHPEEIEHYVEVEISEDEALRNEIIRRRAVKWGVDKVEFLARELSPKLSVKIVVGNKCDLLKSVNWHEIDLDKLLKEDAKTISSLLELYGCFVKSDEVPRFFENFDKVKNIIHSLARQVLEKVRENADKLTIY